MTAIRTLIADDHAMFRAGLRTFLGGEPDIAIIGEATNGQEAQQQCEALQPDVLILDVRMPGPPAADTVRFVHAQVPDTRVVILTAECDTLVVRRLAALDVAGYAIKDDEPKAIIQAIRIAARGETWFSPQVLATLTRGRSAVVDTPEIQLTGREKEGLTLITRGWSNKRIAAELIVTEQTVRNYCCDLYAKLDVHVRPEAIVWAQEHGFESG